MFKSKHTITPTLFNFLNMCNSVKPSHECSQFVASHS